MDHRPPDRDLSIILDGGFFVGVSVSEAKSSRTMNEDLLGSVPDFISIGGLLKASAVGEDGDRFLFFEASNEGVDHQNEVVLQKALKESADYFLRHGNIDLSHYTIMGPKSGVANFMEYEIGKPIEVRVDGKRTIVKAQLYKGESPMARNANMVWDSLTKQSPASRWYPSVGGAVLAKSIKIDPETRQKVAVIEKVRWNNIALDRCPVNRTVPEVSTAPLGVFAKSLGGFVLTKTLEAGYGTDVATLTGGAALRKQSLDRGVQATLPTSYFDFRNQISSALQKGKAHPTAAGMTRYAVSQFGLSEDEAAEWVERFMRDLSDNLKMRAMR